MRLRAIVPAALLCVATSVPWIPVQAASSFPSPGPCPAYGEPPVSICSGEVPSFDGSPLDVDVTLPAANTGNRHPLIVMLHGFANNKHEWESTTDDADRADKWHWNNHWFARHGFYVINYTARGFFDDGPDPKEPSEPATPAGIPAASPPGPAEPCALPGSACPPNGTIHLKSRDFEIRDTQWLAALTAAAYPDLDPNRVAVTGGSYGGGETWTQASQAVWHSAHDLNAALPILQLQVAVPKYPWTDLAYSLAPNGHKGPFDASIYSSSQGSPTDPTDTGQGNPFGNVKFSYVAGFFFEGAIKGIFESGITTTPSEETPPPVILPAWAGRAIAGDPYDAGSPGTDLDIVPQIRRGLTEFRGSYYQDDAWTAERNNREVAIFSISGWTDDLFPPVEAFRQFKYLKSLDRLWPVELAVADVGHPRAQNPPSQWRHLNARAWGFLKEQINGSHRKQTNVSSMPTICNTSTSDEQNLNAAQRLTGRTPEELSSGRLTVNYAKPGAIRNTKLTPAEDPDNLQTDPAFGSALGLPACRQSLPWLQPDPTARYTGLSAKLDRPRIYVGLGYVHVDVKLLGASTATLNARVWDVAPDGKALLVTRGTYRIDGNGTPAGYDNLLTGPDDALTGSLELPLFGNQWTLEAGHQIRLDLTQVDYPTFLPSNFLDALISFNGANLVLPTREATELTIPGD